MLDFLDYRMAGNFRGVDIFMVDLAVTKINAYTDT
jgi:hypothetical protein